MKALENYDRYYLSYSGIRLPLKLVNQLDTQEIDNRSLLWCKTRCQGP